MAGTNDAIMKTSETILVELLQLKSFVEDTLPCCTVIISYPTYRYDDPKACVTVLPLHRKLNNLQIPLILNDNIKDRHIGRKGLHLKGGVQAGWQ